MNYRQLCVYWRWPKKLYNLQLVLVLCSGFLLQFTIGVLINIGNLMPYIISYVRIRSHPINTRINDSVYLFSAQLFLLSFGVLIGGMIEIRLGPRMTCVFGGSFVSIGTLLSYFVIDLSYYALLVTYGISVCFGLGVIFIGTIGCAMRWLPKYRGLAAGIATSGSGIGALLFDVIQTSFINQHNEAPNDTPFPMDKPEEKYYTQYNTVSLNPCNCH